ncbi:RF-1 domain-containing protein [Mycena vitilis]|nr:RF-1 domain-containing protein [Mycena vitilis]
MSSLISQDLRTAARSAYRQLLRASSSTFRGDENVLRAFRLKIRQDAVRARETTDPAVYEQHNALAREIASIVRKNLVQASRTDDTAETWRVRITEETEMGSNESIKNPTPLETSRRARRKEKDTQTSSETPAHALKPPTKPPLFYSALKIAHKNRVVPELREQDLEEAFVRGSGPGGQSVNKTENNVQLLHRPTGLRVSCHETRSLALNRRIARRLLLEKLDKIQNPGLSRGELQQAKQRERERRRSKKAKKKRKEQEDVDDN